MRARITLEADVENFPAYNDPNDPECKGNFYHLLRNAVYQVLDMKMMQLQRDSEIKNKNKQQQLIIDASNECYESDLKLLEELLKSMKVEAV